MQSQIFSQNGMQSTSQSQQISQVQKGPKAKNPNNQFLYDFFESQKQIASRANNVNYKFAINKVLRGLQQYPIPILTERQAQEIDGVGAKFAAKMKHLIDKHYKDHAIPLQNNVNEISISNSKNNSNFNQNSNLAEYQYQNLNNSNYVRDQQQKLNINSLMNSSNDNNANFASKKGKQQKSIKEKVYEPKMYTSGWVILLIMHMYKKEKDISYISTKDIRKKLNQLKIEDSKLDINLNIKSLKDSLQTAQLVNQFDFGEDDVKYCLTTKGEEKATQILESYNSDYLLRLQQQKQINPEEQNQDQEKENEINADNQSISNNSLLVLSEDETFQVRFNDNDNGNGESSQMDLEIFSTISKNSIIYNSQSNIAHNKYEHLPQDFSNIKTYMKNKGASILNKNANQLLKTRLTDIQEEESKDQNQIFQSHNLNIKITADQQKQKLHQIDKKEIESCNIRIIVDNREIKDQQNRNYIVNLLQRGFTVEEMPIALGDYIWVVDIKLKGSAVHESYLLDYIVERKQANDLSSSILDGRYGEQKYRLLNSGIKHLFYLIEGKVTQNTVLAQRTIDQALVSTSVAHGFKILETENTLASVKHLMRLSATIKQQTEMEIKNLMNNQFVSFRFTLAEFNKRMAKRNDINIFGQFGKILRQINGCGRETVDKILTCYSSPNQLYEALMVQPEDCRMALLTLVDMNARQKRERANQTNALNLPKCVAKAIIDVFAK